MTGHHIVASVSVVECGARVVDDQPLLAILERSLGVVFRHKDLLALALVHHSSIDGGDRTDAADDAQSNERLEFLGDAVLGAAAASFLYHTYPELDEGQLTALRSALVRRSTAARYAEEVNLGSFVRVSPAEEGPQGRGTSSVLSAAFEAVLGAIYLDQGFPTAASFLQPFFARHLPLILAADLHRNAKSELQEYSQGRYRVTPVYRVLARTGPAHDSRFLAEAGVPGHGTARGEGSNRQQAEQDAARNLLARLRESHDDAGALTGP